MVEDGSTKPAPFKRKLKSHSKSKAGCKNCKVRRVKCDETKPNCAHCQSYGVRCDYVTNDLLQSSFLERVDGIANTTTLNLRTVSSKKTMLGMINSTIDKCDGFGSGSFHSFRLNSHDLDRLERFQSRTVLSLGTSITGKIYQDEIIKLVCQHPYLMHAVMTVTCMHDRFNSKSYDTARSFDELYHYAQAASLFRQKLLQVIPTSDHDGLWATCAILGTISMFSFDASSASMAWPLKSSTTDLEWLEVLEGINVVWSIVKPTWSSSAFANLTRDRSKDYLLTHCNTGYECGPQQIPQAFSRLCEICQSSSVDNNPYLAALLKLTPLLDRDCNQESFLHFLTFTGHMSITYKQLLRDKDPRALLILAYWYSRVCHAAPWFLASRALIECQAICLYLERYHNDYQELRELVHVPRLECGLPLLNDLPPTPVSM